MTISTIEAFAERCHRGSVVESSIKVFARMVWITGEKAEVWDEALSAQQPIGEAN
jgi:hypothetical protein